MSNEDNNHLEYITSYSAIPEIFQSFETGKMFSSCVDCGKNLLEDGTKYGIQKVYRGNEVILEFAYCDLCHEELFESYSRESQNNIWDFILDRVNLEKRSKRLLNEAWTNLDPWISHCATCNAPKEELEQFIILGDCDGSDLIFKYGPYMFCENCEIAMNECLSLKTKDIWDDWIQRNVDLPPSVQQEIKDGKIAFV